ncbi:MAG: efflux RND transporter periplasmic adaptor subunit [Candidatus Aminicenantales bacterium]
MRKIIKNPVLISLIVLLAGLAGCRKDAANGGQVEISGTIEAVKTEVRAEAQGQVLQILVKEGQKVNKGDLLCVIDAEKIRIQIEQVIAGIDAAEARLRLAKIGTKKEMIAVAKTQVEITSKQLEIAEKDQQRLAKLLGEGAVSQTQKEKADLALKAAQEQHIGAQENYQMALRGSEKEELEMAAADVRGLDAQRQYLERVLRDTEVKSPVKGYIEVKNIELGELAVPGAVLFSIIDLGQTYVKAYIPEQYVGRVKVGSEVAVTCDSFPGKTFKGKADFISEEAEFAPRNIQTKEERLKLVYMVKSYLDNADGELKPGMPVDVKISLKP